MQRILEKIIILMHSSLKKKSLFKNVWKRPMYGALSLSLSILGGSPMLQSKINYTELTMPYFCWSLKHRHSLLVPKTYQKVSHEMLLGGVSVWYSDVFRELVEVCTYAFSWKNSFHTHIFLCFTIAYLS